MAAGSGRAAADAEVVGATAGLVGYLRELVRASGQRVLDAETTYESRVWLGELPEGVPAPSSTGDVLLRLDYEPPTVPPDPPPELAGRLDPAALTVLDADPPLLEQEDGTPADGTPEDGTPADGTPEDGTPADGRREAQRAYAAWLPGWREWAAHEALARPRRALYKQLARDARILSQQDDLYEAVLGIGLLSWVTGSGERIRRHLITRRVDIRLDRRTAQVSVVLVPGAALRLEDREFLDADDGYSAERVGMLRDALATAAGHPLSADTTALVHRWHEIGLEQAVDHQPVWTRPEVVDGQPRLRTAPAIIRRRRDRNAVVEYYDRIAAALDGPAASAPLGLAQLLFSLSEPERLAWARRSAPDGGSPLGADPLFPLPTNPAQRAVLDRLSGDTAVVVQGPPGTGKTHTIANLVSALLAQGQRVLVTSQKDQALRVLRDKLPRAIRDLCVLMASSRSTGIDELERGISALSDRAATSDVDRVTAQISRLEEQRSQLAGRRAGVLAQMCELRESEFVQHAEVAPGYSGRLAGIASEVSARREAYEWLPAGAVADPRPPLDVAEALELLRGLLETTPHREGRRHQRIPAPAELPAADEVDAAVAAWREAQAQAAAPAPLAQQLARLDRADLDEIQRLAAAARTAVHTLGLPPHAAGWRTDDWRAAALLDGLARRNTRLWDLVAARAGHATEVHRSLLQRDLHTVAVPAVSAEQAAAMERAVADLHAHVAAGGRIRGRFAGREQRAAQQVLDAVRVDGRSPRTAEDLALVRGHLRATVAAAGLAQTWAQVRMRLPDADLTTRLATLADWADELRHVQVVWHARSRIDAVLVAHGLRYTISAAYHWDELLAGIEYVSRLVAAQDAAQALTRIDQVLGGLQQVDDPPPELWEARQAIKDRDAGRYRQAVGLLREAAHQQQAQRRCDELAGRLRAAHPVLADQLAATRTDPVWPDRLAQLPPAWAWRVAAEYCERLRRPGRDQLLQQELDDLDHRLGEVTGALAGAQAWWHCLRRMTQEQRSALEAYKSALAAIGKGSGRYVHRHRRQARDAMRVARDAVPAWVMTLRDVVDMIPPQPDCFDVLIIDEASQVGIEAAFLLWLAPRVIVVGDDKQCAPSALKFGELRKIYDRLDAFLPDTPPWMLQGLDPRSNLYELLAARFPGVIRLTEHFRCMPEIIGWSSTQFYDSRLVPLRQYGASRLAPLRLVEVEGGYAEGRDQRIHNTIEAKHITETIVQLASDPAYDGKSFGVIVLQGSEQVRLIDAMISEVLDPAEREARQLRVGTPAEFQGDERDVVLLSMVVSEPGQAQTRRDVQRKYNVAASRARLQMWLFASVRLEQLAPIDLRHSLLGYVQSPPPVGRLGTDVGPVPLDRPWPPFESLFEQRAYRRIADRGYAVAAQVPVEGKRIDLVVVGAHSRLAVECDGDNAATTPDQLRADIERERELRRVGWEFWRLRESEFEYDPDRALEPLWAELDRRDIHPGATLEPVPIESLWIPAELPEADPEEEDDEAGDGDQLGSGVPRR